VRLVPLEAHEAKPLAFEEPFLVAVVARRGTPLALTDVATGSYN
jgi:hypothetical protein